MVRTFLVSLHAPISFFRVCMHASLTMCLYLSCNRLSIDIDHSNRMFNCVGYFNYRYFCNFLIYVFAGLFYGAVLSYKPFRLISAKEFGIQARWSRQNIPKDGVTHMFSMVPLPVERSPIAFTFMLCASVGIAVACLLGFHLYLIFTAQTTIEFHGE